MEGEIFKIRLYKEPWDFGIAMAVFMESLSTGALSVAKPLEFEPFEKGGPIKPTVRISIGEAQNLMDALWREGIRPSNGEGSVGELAATQSHLNDMRQIAFQSVFNGRVIPAVKP